MARRLPAAQPTSIGVCQMIANPHVCVIFCCLKSGGHPPSMRLETTAPFPVEAAEITTPAFDSSPRGHLRGIPIVIVGWQFVLPVPVV